MNKKLILAAIAAMIPVVALADLGSTYAQSCREYGSKGYPLRKYHCMIWKVSQHVVQEWYYNNHCVIIQYGSIVKGSYYVAADAQRMMAMQSGEDELWAPTEGDTVPGRQCWHTTDGKLTASLQNGRVQIGYVWYMEQKGLMDHPDEGEDAPEQDDGQPKVGM